MSLKKIFLLFLIIIIIYTCKTTPKKDKQETIDLTTTTTTTTMATTTTTTTTIQLTTTTLATTTTTTTTTIILINEKEFKEAEDLLKKAQDALAEKYAEDDFNNAKNYLKKSREQNSIDNEQARKDLEMSKEYSKKAYINSYKKRALLKKEEVLELFKEAESLGIPKNPNEDYDKARDFFNQGDENFNIEEYFKSYNNYCDSENSLRKSLNIIKNVRIDFNNKIDFIKKLITEAEKLGAAIYAGDDLENAKKELDNGIKYFELLEYKATKESLDIAEKRALQAIEKTKFALKEIKRLEALKAIKDAGKVIEDASKTNVINKPDYKFEFNDKEKNKKIDLKDAPPDNTGDLSYKDIFLKAIDYIEKAKNAYFNEDYDMAIEYANIAKKIALNVKDDTIKTYYTVRLIPERRDCLWRISEYNFIYNTPFLWPRIWNANKEIIINPDLIFPGQVLAIPNIE